MCSVAPKILKLLTNILHLTAQPASMILKVLTLSTFLGSIFKNLLLASLVVPMVRDGCQ